MVRTFPRFNPPGWLLLAWILLPSLLLKLHNLEHTALTHWDEVFHAIVAENVLKHPLEPTLVDAPYLPYDYRKWGENHVWLHKPILPFWQIALSFAALGVNAFALRLPSALLSTGAVWLTYLIGKELFDRWVGLLAALFQALNPFLVSLVQGYDFADHVDVALLFWVELGVYFLVRSLRTGSWRDVLLAGVAQGFAYLCKSYLAAIILGLALMAWLLPVLRFGKRQDFRINAIQLMGLVGATAVVIVPWLLYCLNAYPTEFWYEQGQIWKHLGGNVEGWAAPWDRLVFDYLIALYGYFYTPILVAGLLLLGTALTQQHKGLWLVYAWALGVLLPHLFAVSKTPSATVLAMPACFLLLGAFVREAWRGQPLALAGLIAVLAISLLIPVVIKKPGQGYASPRAFGVMRQSWWVIEHLIGAVAILAMLRMIVEIVRMAWPDRAAALGRIGRIAGLGFCGLVLCWQGVRVAEAAWRVTVANANDLASLEVGRFARDHLAANAVLLCEEQYPSQCLTIMFYADRTCYPLSTRHADAMARQVRQAGGLPYVVSSRKLPLSPIHQGTRQVPTIYLWEPSAH